MDIITHTISGLTAATIVAPFSRNSLVKKGLILCCGAAGGLLPDIDTISLWSGFDKTIGEIFQLPAKGQDIYFGNYWYSHHSFFHSIVCGLLFASLLFLFVSGWSLSREMMSRDVSIDRSIYKKISTKRLCGLTFFLGYLAHIAGDLPTPAHVWGGVKLLWPLPFSIGGTGQIWWWNNYDIFLLIFGCCLLAVMAVVLSHFRPKQQYIKCLPLIVVVITLTLVFYQINHRSGSFYYTGHTRNFRQYEQQSIDIQKDILGKKCYGIMRRFDQAIPLNY